MFALDMPFILPYPDTPQNGTLGDADPVRANFQAIAQGIQSFDGTQIQPGTIHESALAANINPRLRDSELFDNFVYNGCTWSSGGGLNGSMAGGLVYINGYRTPVNAVGSRSFTASNDTYVFVDYLGNITYLAVSNNATPPTPPVNTVPLAVIITNASAITEVQDIRILRNGVISSIPRTSTANQGATTTEASWNGRPWLRFVANAGDWMRLFVHEPDMSGLSGSGFLRLNVRTSTSATFSTSAALINQISWGYSPGAGVDASVMFQAQFTGWQYLNFGYNNLGGMTGTLNANAAANRPALYYIERM